MGNCLKCDSLTGVPGVTGVVHGGISSIDSQSEVEIVVCRLCTKLKPPQYVTPQRDKKGIRHTHKISDERQLGFSTPRNKRPLRPYGDEQKSSQ